MKYLKAASLAAAMALAAGGAFAQAGMSGSSAAGAGGSTSAGVAGGTGTTGMAMGARAAADASVSATGIAPADGSNHMLEPGMYASMDEMRASRSWISGGHAVPYHVDTRVMGNSSAKITHYYVNVPADVSKHDDFVRWSSLR